ncbi:MAG: PIG-L family deacetylase [Candidatus Omnitrophica bacterium]|nr:PIG-L family deacetylase [Candidatus Omnitrophota bacterium]MDD5352391.1 PIG-L family deacetylase [Candidatus Omnitrophota bacterium]MDD5549989.1 PIG-L family deacetylase [Candidatus Omnitrophota bacterium]
MKNKILVVAAHPDDEILGCGGTVAKMVRGGCSAFVLILGEGITSRYQTKDKENKNKEVKELRNQLYKANKIIGAEKVFAFDLPDNKFDTIALLEIIKLIEETKKKIKPDILYTHHRGDLNIDHRITYNAALTACRPIKGETVKEIYSFETPSSTEWNYPCRFSPNIFVNIADSIDRKIEAMKCYKTELRTFPHPRSEEAVKIIAKRWGVHVGLNYAEAFETIRILK